MRDHGNAGKKRPLKRVTSPWRQSQPPYPEVLDLDCAWQKSARQGLPLSIVPESTEVGPPFSATCTAA
eukprot:4451260-Amphidinium_carterae.1